MDQFGQVQAIGGVNEKVEGFFRVCAERDLTGTQGVLIPKANTLDLHLDDEVVEAVRNGLFHIWEVETVEGGIELMTGIPAGQWTDDEGWSPPDSIYGRCQQRLEEMVALMRTAAKGPGPKTDNSESDDENGSDENP